jgi:hypothetical protein
MVQRKAPLPPRWFIKTFWHVHRRIVRASGGRKGLWRPRPDKWGALRQRKADAAPSRGV